MSHSTPRSDEAQSPELTPIRSDALNTSIPSFEPSELPPSSPSLSSPRHLRLIETKRIEQVNNSDLRARLLRDLDATTRAGVVYGSESKHYRKKVHKLLQDIDIALSNQSVTALKPITASSASTGTLRFFLLLQFLVVICNPFFLLSDVQCNVFNTFNANLVLLGLFTSILSLIFSSVVIVLPTFMASLVFAILSMLTNISIISLTVLIVVSKCVEFTDYYELFMVCLPLILFSLLQIVFLGLICQRRRVRNIVAKI
ncbi:hypothetical protein RCL1_007015 [Eukaryota sp. TZLM3-RCL]